MIIKQERDNFFLIYW